MEPLDTKEEADGAALAPLFFQALRAINDYLGFHYKIYFGRTSSAAEVDFVIYGSQGFHAFEIEKSSLVNTSALRGLKSFYEDYPEAKLHFLYLGKNKEYLEQIEAIPIWKRFLKTCLL